MNDSFDYRMMAAQFAVIVAASILLVASGRRGWRPSLAVALAVGLGLRLALLVMSYRIQPYDFANDFPTAGENVLAHQDPILNARPTGWNYLPTYALMLAGMVWVQHETNVSWLIIGRLAPIAFDVGVAVLVGVLVGGRDGSLRRFQYACSPLPILVSAVHGQMEPFCLLLAIGAFALLLPPRMPLPAGRVVAAGVLFGLAVSAKSWPVVLLPSLLLMVRGWRDRWRLLLAMLGVLIALFVTMPLTVGTPIGAMDDVARRMVDYRPTVGTWGWASVLVQVRPPEGPIWTDPFYARVSDVGAYLSLVVLAIAIWWWRRAHPLDLALVTTSSFQVATAAHGMQYLNWPAPFMTMRPTFWTDATLIVMGFYAAIGYLVFASGALTPEGYAAAVSTYQMASLAIVALLILALPWHRRVDVTDSMQGRRARSRHRMTASAARVASRSHDS